LLPIQSGCSVDIWRVMLAVAFLIPNLVPCTPKASNSSPTNGRPRNVRISQQRRGRPTRSGGQQAIPIWPSPRPVAPGRPGARVSVDMPPPRTIDAGQAKASSALRQTHSTRSARGNSLSNIWPFSVRRGVCFPFSITSYGLGGKGRTALADRLPWTIAMDHRLPEIRRSI
jgi:hypothetical protein